MSIGMAPNNFASRMVELKISTQAPNSNPNPSEDHEADGLYLAKIGLETFFYHQSNCGRPWYASAEHSRATETLPLETKVVHAPQSGSPINQSRCDGQMDTASGDD